MNIVQNNRLGQIVTFYSYKGGVGRTMALANVAVQLARWGHRVLCVDWDLEAPGLHLYFADWHEHPIKQGLVDLVTQAAADERTQWRDYVTPLRPPGAVTALPINVDTLHLLAAGAADPDYVTKVQSLDWTALYDVHNIGTFLEGIRADWKDTYDFVLIDSRTGLTDIGGICTVQLPDVVVLMFTASGQSLEGIKSVASRAIERRNLLPLERARLLCVPVPSRFDTRVEYATSKEWLARFAAELRSLYSDWLHREVAAEQMVTQLRLPYIPFWSYGERLPVVQESNRDPESLSYAFETLSALIAHRIEDTQILASNRDSFVSLAVLPGWETGQQSIGGFVYDLFMSAPPGDGFSVTLTNELQTLGWRVFSSSDPSPSTGRLEREQALRRCQHLIIVLGSTFPTVQQYEISEFLRTSLVLYPSISRRVVPVWSKASESLPELPAVIRDFQLLDVGGLQANDAARAIDRLLGGSKAHAAALAQPFIDAGALVSLVHPILFDDPDERHGSFVSTRGRHTVEVPYEYKLSRLLVTNADFLQFVGSGGYDEDDLWPALARGLRRKFVCQDGYSFGPATWKSSQTFPVEKGDHPVAGICYYEAKAFINWLNRLAKDKISVWMLPSEDMWEIAARGSQAFVYPWGNEFRTGVCNSLEEGIGSTTPVGAFPTGSGPYGNLDLAGNVWEFVDADTQPDWSCVLRGGSFVNNREEVKGSLRLFGVPREHRPPDFGFRCAQTFASKLHESASHS